jgi:hypothetical protein
MRGGEEALLRRRRGVVFMKRRGIVGMVCECDPISCVCACVIYIYIYIYIYIAKRHPRLSRFCITQLRPLLLPTIQSCAGSGGSISVCLSARFSLFLSVCLFLSRARTLYTFSHLLNESMIQKDMRCSLRHLNSTRMRAFVHVCAGASSCIDVCERVFVRVSVNTRS